MEELKFDHKKLANTLIVQLFQDKGEEFSYTGSGGRDLSGNKRTAEQSCDQTLTRMNR